MSTSTFTETVEANALDYRFADATIKHVSIRAPRQVYEPLFTQRSALAARTERYSFIICLLTGVATLAAVTISVVVFNDKSLLKEIGLALLVSVFSLPLVVGIAFALTGRINERQDTELLDRMHPDMFLPANVRTAWVSLRRLVDQYATDPEMEPTFTALEAVGLVAVNEIAVHASLCTTKTPECRTLIESLFNAVAQAEAYDTLRRISERTNTASQTSASLNHIDLSTFLMTPA